VVRCLVDGNRRDFPIRFTGNPGIMSAPSEEMLHQKWHPRDWQTTWQNVIGTKAPLPIDFERVFYNRYWDIRRVPHHLSGGSTMRLNAYRRHILGAATLGMLFSSLHLSLVASVCCNFGILCTVCIIVSIRL
jgi:hypothetical protein